MSQIWKNIIIVIITAAVVGGGVYFWLQNKTGANPQVVQQERKDQKVFEGNGFSFVYPAKYTADDKGLWTEEGYEWHINPPETCSLCQVPYIEVNAEATNETLDKYIITSLGLLGNSLKEMSQQTETPYEQIKIGGRDFVKITVSEMLTTTGYYTKNKNTAVSFRVFGGGWDEGELQGIVGSLKFE